MKLEANANGDVTVLRQTIAIDFHALVDLPANPLRIYRCLRKAGSRSDDTDDDHDDDTCDFFDLIDVLDFTFDVRVE